MKIRKFQIQEADLIYKYLPANYIECLQCNFSSRKKVSSDDIMIAFWTDSPQWVERLFKLRNLLVKPFGIQGGNNDSRHKLEKSIRTGGTYKFMSISEKSDEETILCANDKHLVMYLSIKVKELNERDKDVTVSTLVKFHNLLGRVYFSIIYPFHYIIVRSMLKSVLKKFENQP
ncbi:uncharacterized protein DUF2867 [Dysgonomonas alginatilytica]|uniref:Uncharacterized protein DUF2867 n=1 Tax=Dysgonomonas alginatilytica TaxID=1605892 RepID=A0A2V3PVK6_9BACT|nr:DUF2867 domain-containing protein [Dysgonomonas alginatilytica]PXV69162.1 uncharacterized protein DUF2867 [Dysgonomonas alginatilytica]